MPTYPLLGKPDSWADKVNPDAHPVGGNCAVLAVGPHYDYTTKCEDGHIVYSRKMDWTTSVPNGNGGCDVEHQFLIQPIITDEPCDSQVSYPVAHSGEKEWKEAMALINSRAVS